MTEESGETQQQSPDNAASENKTEAMPPNEASSAPAAAPAGEKETDGQMNNDDAKAPLSDEADPKVKFISNNQETKVEIGEDKAANPYPALTKAELMEFASDPTWVRMRWALFILFWVAWVGMLVASVIIIVLAPKCYTPAPKQWWQKGPVYEVYVKSFKDSDGDGIGDLKGIESKLDYLSELGVSSVWLSPIYASPQKDNGYDIKDYEAIDPMFGTMDDFKSLAAGLHERGIKLIMDFVPNHSSDEHAWFQKSVRKEEPYTDYYVWKTGSASNPPNNWRSLFGGSAWEFNTQRNEWYLHQFYKEQPDLNVRNPDVVKELQDILKFWMNLGVDGFRMDAVAHMFESEGFEDEAKKDGAKGNEYTDYERKYTYDLPEVLDLLKKFRETLNDGPDGDVDDPEDPRIMLTEVYLPTDQLVKYYGKNFTEHSGDISHLPLNFKFIEEFKNKGDATATKMESVIRAYLQALPTKAWPNFNMGNHDNSRVATRVGNDLTDAMNIIIMMMPGTPIIYYGEEIGMTDYTGIPNTDDYRNPERTPMQWNAEAEGGFSDLNAQKNSWLPINPNYKEINVAEQEENPRSHLNIFRELSKMRQQKSVLYGDTRLKVFGDVLAFTRVRKGNPGYLVVVNFGSEEATIDTTGMRYMSSTGTVHVRSFDPNEVAPTEDSEDVGKYVSFSELHVRPKEGLVITFVPNMDNKGGEE